MKFGKSSSFVLPSVIILIQFLFLAACTTNCKTVITPIRETELHPHYTKAAVDAKIEGIVILQLIIGKQGNVIQVQPLRGLPYGLTESAVATANKLHFKPAYRKCTKEPVDSLYTITIMYKLSDTPKDTYYQDKTVTDEMLKEMKEQNKPVYP